MTLERAIVRRRIVVTRHQDEGREEAHAFRRLSDLGAELILFPTIRFESIRDDVRFAHCVTQLETYDWLLFTSGTAVREFASRLAELRIDLMTRFCGKIAASGPVTAEALTALGWPVSVIPTEYRGEALCDALLQQGVSAKKMLFPRAEVARELLVEGLRRGGAEVDLLPLYRTVRARLEEWQSGYRAMMAAPVDMIVFTSASMVNHFVKILGEEKRAWLSTIPLAVIGPVTRDACEAWGLSVRVIPCEYTIAQLIEAIVAYFNQKEDDL